MRILKIIDGFVTNSSSSGVVIILALQKGKNMKDFIKKIGIPKNLPNHIFMFQDLLENDEGYFEGVYQHIEVDHLTDEYDILIYRITVEQTGGPWYSMSEKERAAVWEVIRKLKNYNGKEIVFLYESHWI